MRDRMIRTLRKAEGILCRGCLAVIGDENEDARNSNPFLSLGNVDYIVHTYNEHQI